MNQKVQQLLSILKTAAISKKNDYVYVENTKKVLICVEKLYEEGILLHYTLENKVNEQEINENHIKKTYIKIKIRELDGEYLTKNIKII